jgi:hypothetical protein
MLLGFSWLHAQGGCVPQAPGIFVTGNPGGPYGAYYLWGQQVEVNLSPYYSYSGDFYRIEYSLDYGASWTTAASNLTEFDFPVTITLPPLAPPNYESSLFIRVVAVCNNGSEDEGILFSTPNYAYLYVSDRLGNRPNRAIPITLGPSGPGTWRFTHRDSTDGPTTTDVYNVRTVYFSPGARWGSDSRDLFFSLTLPECLDSLVVTTCSRNTNFNTRIHIINFSTNDTITNDDQGSSCTSAGGSVDPNLLSRLVVFGLPNRFQVTQTDPDDIGIYSNNSAKVVRDTALLVQGHTLYIVVEGSDPSDEGEFELIITGYKIRRPINITGAPIGSVCINSAPITLDATTPGATAYQWLDADDNPIPGATSATYTVNPNAEGRITVKAMAILNPNNDPSCITAYDFVTSQSVTIIVEDTARAQIADANNDPVSNRTLLITAGSDVTLNVSSPQNTGNTYTWKRYNSIPPSGTPTTSSGNTLTINNISAGDYTVVLEAVRGSGACDPTQDTVYLQVCPSSTRAPQIGVTNTYQPLAGSDYLWGQQVEIGRSSSPDPIGDLRLIYSDDGGRNWTQGPSVSSFPVTITLPPLTPPTYRVTRLIAVVAEASAICNLRPDTSNHLSINITDRPGNRADNAITIDLDETSPGSGIWTATISDSTDGLAISDEYTGLPRAQAARDLFFLIRLPACLDSLDISLCSSTGTLTNSYIHLINATAGDTIDSDDGCSTGNLSRIVAIGTPNANTRNADPSSKPARDSLLLVRGHTLYLVVEGNGSATGKFTVNITGYKTRPSSIDVTGAPSGPVCVKSAPITLNATTPGATAYQWLDANGNPIQGATSATYTVNPNAEGRIIVRALAVFNPNDDPSCPTRADSVTSQPVTITVEDTARAQIADANNNVVSGRTLSFTAGSNVTLKVRSSQNTGNTYTWKRYNSIPPSGTPTTSSGNNLTINNISAGRYTVVLEAVRGTGACGTTRDTVYLSVTTGLRTDAGTFSIFPNPNTGAFTIVAPAMDTYRIQVLDVAGRLVAEDAFTGSTHQMRLSLPAGVYQIRLVAGDKAHIGRLIITE